MTMVSVGAEIERTVNDMRLMFLRKKEQTEAVAYLVGIARFIHKHNVQIANIDFESYAYVIEALAELAYVVGGIKGMNTVRQLGFEWKDGEG